MTVDLIYREMGPPDGDGPVLIVLHALFANALTWGAINRALSRRHRLIAPDLRNHGASPHVADMDYGLMAGDVLRLMDRLAIGRAVLIGHSMGGKTALHLALRAPERVCAVVAVDIAPVRYDHGHDTVLEAMRGLDLARLSRREEADAQLATRLPEASVRQFVLTNLVRHDGRFAWRVNLEALAANMKNLADFPVPPEARYDGPALIIRGALSDYVRSAHCSVIAALFPRARIVTLKGAGHWVNADQPALLIQTLEAFLDRL